MKPTLQTKLWVLSTVLVTGLAVAAAAHRIYTAPERILKRLETAKATCLSAGGQWVQVGRDEVCRAAAERKP